jgi:hypothetical protein
MELSADGKKEDAETRTVGSLRREVGRMRKRLLLEREREGRSRVSSRPHRRAAMGRRPPLPRPRGGVVAARKEEDEERIDGEWWRWRMGRDARQQCARVAGRSGGGGGLLDSALGGGEEDEGRR